MLRIVRKIINSQVKKHHAQKEQGLLVSKFNSVESELNELQHDKQEISLSESKTVETQEKVQETIQEKIQEKIQEEILETTPVSFSEAVNTESIKESVIVIVKEQELNSWKSYSEAILDLLEMDSQSENESEEVIWYHASDSEDSKKSKVEKQKIEAPENEIAEEIKPIVYFHNIEFEQVEETILAKFSFIKHENLSIKLNKHLDKENIAIHFKLENKKEIGLINKLLPSLVQELGLNLTTEVFKSKSDLSAFKVVLKEGDKKNKKKTNREVHA